MDGQWWMDGWMTDGWTFRCMYVSMDGWIDRCTNGWMDR